MSCFLVTFSLRTRGAAHPCAGKRGQLGWTCCLCCMSLRDSRGPGKAGWVPVLGSSSPRLGDVTSGSLGVEVPGEWCRRPQARPRAQVRAHGALQPTVHTQRHTRSLTPFFSGHCHPRPLTGAHHSRPATLQRDPGFQPLQLPSPEVLGSQRGDTL